MFNRRLGVVLPAELPKMEPLAALGLAGNIVTFIEFAQKIVTKSIEIYQSSSNTSQNVEDLNNQLRGFIFSVEQGPMLKPRIWDRRLMLWREDSPLELHWKINENGFNDAIKCLVGHSTMLAYHSPAKADVALSPVQAVAARCFVVAQTLLRRLDHLRDNEGQHRIWSSLKVAVQEIWAEPELQRMKDDLETCKAELRLQILLELR